MESGGAPEFASALKGAELAAIRKFVQSNQPVITAQEIAMRRYGIPIFCRSARLGKKRVVLKNSLQDS
jgi:hypothetical protein